MGDYWAAKESTHSCYNVGEPWKQYVKWKKAVTKDHILYDFTNMKCPQQVYP